ncbi:MAG: hypothetical protein ACO1RX_19170 [Candidatus Sericytochromatia bacterium]
MRKTDVVLNPFWGLVLTHSYPVAGAGLYQRSQVLNQAGELVPQLRELAAAGFFRSLEQLLLAPDLEQLDLPSAHWAQFEALGLVIPSAQVAHYPAYRVPLLSPALSVPATLRHPLPPTLCFNPRLHFQWDSAPPAALSSALRGWDALKAAPPLLWVCAPHSHFWSPYSLPADALSELEKLTRLPEKAALAKLPPGLRERLFAAQVLIAPAERLLLESAVPPLAKVLADSLAAQDYLILQALLPPLQVSALRSHIQSLTAQGFFMLGDAQVPQRGMIHNEPVLRFWQFQVAHLLQALIPGGVKASYAYLATYAPGATLHPHTDRAQCTWNLSLLLDSAPEQARANAWPLYLQTGTQTTRVQLGLGDAVLYPGARMPHWRETLPADQYVSLGLLHFVAPDFAEDLN